MTTSSNYGIVASFGVAHTGWEDPEGYRWHCNLAGHGRPRYNLRNCSAQADSTSSQVSRHGRTKGCWSLRQNGAKTPHNRNAKLSWQRDCNKASYWFISSWIIRSSLWRNMFGNVRISRERLAHALNVFCYSKRSGEAPVTCGYALVLDKSPSSFAGSDCI